MQYTLIKHTVILGSNKGSKNQVQPLEKEKEKKKKKDNS